LNWINISNYIIGFVTINRFPLKPLIIMSIKIRNATLADIPFIDAIYSDELRASRRKEKPSSLGSKYPQADKDFIQRQSDGEIRYQVVVAEKDNVVIGYARALHRLDRKPSNDVLKPTEKQTTLHKLGVLDSEQGNGVGRLLMNAIFQKAHELNRTKMRIVLPQGNPMAFYERFGFKKVAYMPAPSKNMRPLDVVDSDVNKYLNKFDPKQKTKKKVKLKF
jgi:predicted N-acetyltransferase YhbS